MDANGVLGRDVIDLLENVDASWISELRLFGGPQDTSVHYKGTDVAVRPFSVDAFRDVEIAIGGGEREVKAGAVAVCVGGETPVVLTELNAVDIEEHRGTVCVPDGAATALALTARAFDYKLERIAATILHPASLLGPRALAELYEQQVALFNRGAMPTDVLGDRLAFNILAAETGAVGAAALVGCELEVTPLLAPLFGGTTLVMDLFAGSELKTTDAGPRLQTAIGLDLCDEVQPAEIVGQTDVRVRLMSETAGRVRVVAVVDEVRRTAASLLAAAREIAEQDAF